MKIAPQPAALVPVPALPTVTLAPGVTPGGSKPGQGASGTGPTTFAQALQGVPNRTAGGPASTARQSGKEKQADQPQPASANTPDAAQEPQPQPLTQVAPAALALALSGATLLPPALALPGMTALSDASVSPASANPTSAAPAEAVALPLRSLTGASSVAPPAAKLSSLMPSSSPAPSAQATVAETRWPAPSSAGAIPVSMVHARPSTEAAGATNPPALSHVGTPLSANAGLSAAAATHEHAPAPALSTTAKVHSSSGPTTVAALREAPAQGDAGASAGGNNSGSGDTGPGASGNAAQPLASVVSPAAAAFPEGLALGASPVAHAATQPPEMVPLGTSAAPAAGKPREVAGAGGPSQPAAAAPLTAVSSARVLGTMSGTEMRVGVHSADLGTVSISTSLSASGGVAAQIAVDHGELGKALLAHLPAMEEKLSGATGNAARVELKDGSLAQTAGGGAGGESRGQQPETRSPSSAAPTTRYGYATDDVVRAAATPAGLNGAVGDISGRLNVHA